MEQQSKQKLNGCSTCLQGLFTVAVVLVVVPIESNGGIGNAAGTPYSGSHWSTGTVLVHWTVLSLTQPLPWSSFALPFCLTFSHYCLSCEKAYCNCTAEWMHCKGCDQTCSCLTGMPNCTPVLQLTTLQVDCITSVEAVWVTHHWALISRGFIYACSPGCLCWPPWSLSCLLALTSCQYCLSVALTLSLSVVCPWCWQCKSHTCVKLL